MGRSQLPHTGSAANADPSALDEQPPGVDRPGWINPFSHIFSVDNQARSQPDLAGIIRLPTGLPSGQVGQGIDTPRGSTTPLSAALSRALAAGAAQHDVDAPPPAAHQPTSYIRI